MATALAKTPAEVGELTMPEVLDLFDYWRTNPPVHEMVAAYLGIEGSRASGGGKVPSLSDLQAQMAMVNGG